MILRGGRLVRLGVAALLVALAIGCSAGRGPTSGPSPPDLQARLVHARQLLDDAASITFTMATDTLPSGVPGLLEASGVGTHDPAFKGQVKVAAAGSSISADVVSVGGNVYAKLGFSPIYLPLAPGDYGAPDPAELLDPERGVSTFLTATKDVAGGGQVRQSDQVFTTITGTLPGKTIQAVIPSADPAADFSVEYRLSTADEVRSAVITGPFYSGSADVTYTLSLDPSNETVEITAP